MRGEGLGGCVIKCVCVYVCVHTCVLFFWDGRSIPLSRLDWFNSPATFDADHSKAVLQLFSLRNLCSWLCESSVFFYQFTFLCFYVQLYLSLCCLVVVCCVCCVSCMYSLPSLLDNFVPYFEGLVSDVCECLCIAKALTTSWL